MVYFNNGASCILWFLRRVKQLIALSRLPSRNYPICYCGEEKTSFVCPIYGFTEPRSYKTATGDMIYDISGQNESQYYLYTADKFRYLLYFSIKFYSWSIFYVINNSNKPVPLRLRRYGGISLGLVRQHVPKGFGKKSRSLFGKIAVRHAAKVWYDDNGYHSVATYLNVLNNGILRANLPGESGSPAGYGTLK